ncbi:rieske ferredoxin [Haematococcus lacustris]|uniref:Rieske domain-containing protein n=1 Tax=Haematococcus lacustris TaxID=44745 RepID=A0A699Z6U6_HAELA|nr:hypothetical protein QJQ45_015709 [Haematococcus lacustris]GFH17210.1 rieske domain-containing protein [Haematococcus lacustris]
MLTRSSAPVSRCETIGRRNLNVCCAWTKAASKAEVAGKGGRLVVELKGQRVLLADAGDGNIYAVSNKCSHLGLPLVGKTALLQGKVVDKCIVCPAHNTAYDLATGQVKGKWCPTLPEALSEGFGLTPKKPLPTFASRVTEAGEIEVDI